MKTEVSKISSEELNKLLRKGEETLTSTIVAPIEVKQIVNPKTPSENKKEVVSEDSLIEIERALLPQENSQYKPIAFEDPIELLYFADENIASGRIKLHDWQTELLLLLAHPSHTYENRLKFLLAAANGSGKDAFIIAPFAVWQLCAKVRSRFIGSSASAQQITTQTNPYISNLVQRTANRLIKEGYSQKPFVTTQRPFHIVSTFSGGEILTFVTDKAGSIEGYHPWPDAPNADLTICLNETKSIEDDFIDAFSRCTYNRWLEITSPGRTTGKNWEHYNASLRYPNKYISGPYYSRRVTSYDCPHKSQKAIEEDKISYGGEQSELFRSKHLAEYTSIGESVILSLDIIDKYMGAVKPFYDGQKLRRGGLDLSLGGDETVLVVREGNETKYIEGTRIKDATLLESYLDKLFSRCGLEKTDIIFTDIGGLGKPIYQHLINKRPDGTPGWKLAPFLFNNPAIGFDKNLYFNRGTEVYFEVCNYFSRGFIKGLPDKIWREQLGSRKYIRPNNDKIRLQPKAELAKDKDKQALSTAKEWNSPDRADAWVMAYSDFEPSEIILARENKKDNDNRGSLKRVTQNALIEHYSRNRFAGYELPGELNKPEKCKVGQGSLIEEQLKIYKGGR